MKLTYLHLPCLILILLACSCTPYKQVPYFQNLAKDSVTNEKIGNYSQLKVQPGDLLSVDVNSLNHEADLMFNYNLERQPSGADLDRLDQNAVVGYLVSQEGNINLPLIGQVQVAGLSTEQISVLLQTKIGVYLSNPVINTRLLNFKISVIGDVKNPGSFNIQNEKVTLLDALSLAGDLNTTGIRTNVLLIRELNGNREYVHFDLNSKDIFSSPYFYLKNNDVIYVQPNKAKTTADDASIAKIGAVISALSIIVYLVTR